MRQQHIIILLAGLLVLAGVFYFVQRDRVAKRMPETARRGAAGEPAPGNNGQEVQRDGRWRRAQVPPEDFTTEETERLTHLHALPYVQGSTPATGQSSVTIHMPDAYPGLNLYNSGHLPEAFLVDMEGSVLHSWRLDVNDVWPKAKRQLSNTYWRKVHAYPNGDLLVLFDNHGLVRIDRDSRIIWERRDFYHHDIDVAGDGTIYALAHKATRIHRINRRDPVLPDYIAILDSTGVELERHSLLECIENSKYTRLEHAIPRKLKDIFHTNSIRVFDGSMEKVSPYYKEGNVLLSILRLDAIVIIDPRQTKVVWAFSGRDKNMFSKQHDPTLLPYGSMLLFDNRGYRGRSKVLEFDPSTGEIVWQILDSDAFPFYSETCGTAVRLPNGNTLITESDNGRAFEVTREKEVVWEFYNPHRAGENNEFVATLFEVQRLDSMYFTWAPPARP